MINKFKLYYLWYNNTIVDNDYLNQFVNSRMANSQNVNRKTKSLMFYKIT